MNEYITFEQYRACSSMSLIRSPQFSIIISSFWLFLGQFRAPCSLSNGHFGEEKTIKIMLFIKQKMCHVAILNIAYIIRDGPLEKFWGGGGGGGGWGAQEFFFTIQFLV